MYRSVTSNQSNIMANNNNGPIYTGDRSSVRDKLWQRTVARLIIRLCINNTGKQTDHPSTRAIAIVCLVRPTIVDNSSRRMIRLATVLSQSSSQTDDPSPV